MRLPGSQKRTGPLIRRMLANRCAFMAAKLRCLVASVNRRERRNRHEQEPPRHDRRPSHPSPGLRRRRAGAGAADYDRGRRGLRISAGWPLSRPVGAGDADAGAGRANRLPIVPPERRRRSGWPRHRGGSRLSGRLDPNGGLQRPAARPGGASGQLFPNPGLGQLFPVRAGGGRGVSPPGRRRPPVGVVCRTGARRRFRPCDPACLGRQRRRATALRQGGLRRIGPRGDSLA